MSGALAPAEPKLRYQHRLEDSSSPHGSWDLPFYQGPDLLSPTREASSPVAGRKGSATDNSAGHLIGHATQVLQPITPIGDPNLCALPLDAADSLSSNAAGMLSVVLAVAGALGTAADAGCGRGRTGPAHQAGSVLSCEGGSELR